MCDWVCYLIMSLDDNCTYIDSTNNFEQRLFKHNSSKGAKYTNGKTWLPIIIVSGFDHKNSCLSFEAGWKKLSKNRANSKLYYINQMCGSAYIYTTDTKWNRIMDLLFFVHNFTYIGTKFKLNHYMVHPFNFPEEFKIKIFFEYWIKDLPWPYFINF